MLRSIQEILDQADELAKRFEDYQPGEGDQVPVEEYLPRRAARARSERKVVDAVTAARSSDISWNKIGEILGTSAHAAQQRYGAVVEQT
jgi:Rad3-related DNA helicase